MNRIKTALGLIGYLFALTNGFGQQRNYHPSMDEAAVTNVSDQAQPIKPLFDADLTDVYVLSQAGTYYLTGTSPKGGVHLWSSPDLKRWTNRGIIWNKPAIAPQIHALNGAFYIVYAKPAGGIELLSSPKIDGTFSRISTLTEAGSDPGLFADTDGSVYLYYGEGWVAPLSSDLKTLRQTPKKITPAPTPKDKNDEFNFPFTFKRDPPVTDRVGKHGAFLTKIGAKYYLFAGEVTGRMGLPTDDVYYATADRIDGPWSDRNLVIPHGSQTAVFEANGQLYATFSGNDPGAAIQHKPALVELKTNELGLLIPSANVVLEKGAVGRAKPLLGDERMRDPSVTMGGDGNYYAVGTKDFGWVYPEGGIEMWRSTDLTRWEPMGFVWTFAKDGTAWMKNTEHKRGDRKMLWAPEVAYVKGNYWITMCMNMGKTSILKSTTGKPEGPYQEIATAPIADGIDGFLFEDSDKSVYLIWGDGNIARMNEAMSGFAEPPRKLKTVNNEHVGYEGNCLIKANGKYIMTGAEWNGPLRTEGTYDLMYAVSDNIYGPYSSRRVGIPHGGHSTVFRGKNGQWYSTIFGNDRTAPFRRRLGIVPLTISDDFTLKPQE